jgi:hypothetical protein
MLLRWHPWQTLRPVLVTIQVELHPVTALDGHLPASTLAPKTRWCITALSSHPMRQLMPLQQAESAGVLCTMFYRPAGALERSAAQR